MIRRGDVAIVLTGAVGFALAACAALAVAIACMGVP